MGKEKVIFQSRCDDIGRCFEALDRQYAKLQRYFGGILCLNVFFKLRFFSSVSHKCYIFVVVFFACSFCSVSSLSAYLFIYAPVSV